MLITTYLSLNLLASSSFSGMDPSWSPFSPFSSSDIAIKRALPDSIRSERPFSSLGKILQLKKRSIINASLIATYTK